MLSKLACAPQLREFIDSYPNAERTDSKFDDISEICSALLDFDMKSRLRIILVSLAERLERNEIKSDQVIG